MTYSIYCITNKINGKKYVGLTSRKIDKRWRDHVKESKQEYAGMFDSPLQADIRKYGEDCFTYEVLVATEDKELAMQLEDEATIILDTLVPNGYNRQVGHHCEHTEETKKKMSESRSGENHPMWGKHHTEETRKKMSESKSGENNPYYGKHHSDETRKKMSENHCDNSGANNPRARKCICVETGQTFDTIREASKSTGVNELCIGRCCAGKQKTAGDYHWEYVLKEK